MEIIKDYLWTEQTNSLDNQKIYETSLQLELFLKKSFNYSEVEPKKIWTTEIFSMYNIFTYPDEELLKLYQLLVKTIKPYLDKNIEYMIQAWLNVYQKDEFIPWHGHWPPNTGVWHGYYCVNVSESITSYKLDNKVYQVYNNDGLIVIGRSGRDNHQSSPWTQDKPRVTIAYDIIPVQSITRRGINHYLPF